uniref:TNRC6 PABC binding domain-containing protein n=1 Tax=Amphiprion ocellaris TaxID=80972 RepID=A0AAQ5Z573_AMPOC
MHQMPNSQSGSITSPQAQLQQQQSQPRNQHPQLQQALDQGAMQGGGGRKLISQAQNQNQSSGWTTGPIPGVSGGGGSGSEPSGWEEPSPQSISRKNEIDDGTSAWGDPTHYNYKPVNLWDKNSGPAGQQPHGQGQAQQQQQQQQQQQPPPPQGPPIQQQPSRQAAGPGGNRDFNTGHGPGKASAMGPSGWGGTSPASPTVDNGTAAWGKPSDAPTGWGEPDDAAGKTCWGNPSSNSIKSGSKSMQDGWGDKESSVAASRHSSWEDEEEGGGMWNSTGSQGSGSVLKQMPPPSGSVGGVGGVGGVAGVGGGVFPPQLSPQHIAMLSSIYPPHIQFQLACQLLLQQQQQQPQQQQQQLLQNQRKFTPNVRQQADPQQLARIMAVLQQQRQQQQAGGLGGSSKLSPSHHGGGGGGGPKLPGADPLPHPGLAGSVVDLHQKNLGPYSGFGSGVNLPGLDLGGSVVGGPGPMKDLGSQQSRFKWMMEGHCSPDTSSPENPFHKNGPVTPIKMPGGSPYSQYDMMVGDGLGDNWHRTPGNKMGAKPTNTPSWPPEFQPGVPWKGIDRVDPESDPYMTPGSMMGNTVSPGLNDTEHQLLQDNTDSTPPLNTLLPSPGAWPYSASDSPLNNAHNSAKYTYYKASWPPEPIGHKSWKASRGSSQTQLSRLPPGLASQKQPSPSPWSGGAPRLAGRGWGSGSSTTGSTWSDGSSRESCWLVLSNLTPQIDGSTLRTICMQHGPLLTFHLGLTQGTALIRYGSKQEAAKAQSALHMCVLGNTTILAEFMSEEDVARYIAHSQAGGAGSAGSTASSTGSGPSATSAVGANGNGGSCERGGAGGSSAGGGVEGVSTAGGAGSAGAGSSSSGWQSLDSTGSSSDQTATQGPGLGVFTQWGSNGAGVGGVGGAEAGRQGLWGGMGGMSGAGYPSSSLWGSPPLEDRHQMGSPASLLPGDLLGGGADSI